MCDNYKYLQSIFRSKFPLLFIVVEIDKLNKETPIFGPHLLTDDESIRINKPGNIMATTTAKIVENARRQKEKKEKTDKL